MRNSISITDGVLSIHDLDVSDHVTVTYIDQLEPGARESGALNCLQLGARALTFASDHTGATLVAETLRNSTETTKSLLAQVSKTAGDSVTKSAQTLEKAIEELLADLNKDLSAKLDPANAASIIGRLRTTLVDDYKNVTAKVREELDLTNPNSPLSALRAELEKNEERRYEALTGQLSALSQRLAARDAAMAERAKSTRKGNDFEAATEEFLTSESTPRKDLVRRTTNEFGLDQNFVGDFVIELNPAEGHGARVVVECKNGHKTTAGVVRELGKAMKNRGAAFGICVVTQPIVAAAIVPFGDDKLIVRVPPVPDDEGWDFLALGVALEGARWKIIMAQVAAGALDIKRMQADIQAAFTATNRFAEVKQKLTAGKRHLDAVGECVDEIKCDLLAALQRVQETIAQASSTPEAA